MACRTVLAEHPLINPAVAVTAHLDLPGAPEATPIARRFIRSYLDDVVPAVADDILLLTSELVTNVVLHARTTLHLGICRDAETVLVSVQDHTCVSSPERDAAAGLAALIDAGRGISIVAGLADDFGWKRSTDGGGKIMWFAVSLRRHVRLVPEEQPVETAL